jgi:hypothetical protein
VNRIRFLHEAPISEVDHSTKQEEPEYITEHRYPEVELPLVDLNTEVVVNEHHGGSECENEESEVDKKVRDRRTALTSTNLSLEEPVLDQVVEPPPPVPHALWGGATSAPQEASLQNAVYADSEGNN